MKIRSYLDQIMITKKILTVDDRYFVQKLIALGWSDWRTPDENMISLYCYLLCALIKEKSSINLFSINLFLKKKELFDLFFILMLFYIFFIEHSTFFNHNPSHQQTRRSFRSSQHKVVYSLHNNSNILMLVTLANI